ncbi:hypothetical protein [Sulfuriroseicoccus oceanibius]|uniref:Lipoprotein n=1 Tax=Sulfuriroseicoccus oceanibius TaxID=2707525 RepID=A0A6B3L1Q8_9BACT|nr:hypothetical protein [Sulfuriroseicoccus oceanibius]QQL46299.1 hypothetical protein G3M56_006925 [Sulfuriroseicoccus oceanibius]
MKVGLIISIIAMTLGSCVTRQDGAINQDVEKVRALPVEELPRIPADWNAENFSAIIGYRFRIPDVGEEGSSDVFTLCRDGEINTRLLEKYQEEKSDLSPGQSNSLLSAIFSGGEALPHVACYVPHHIFIFYGADGEAKRAIEVCFECNGVQTIPTLAESQWRKHDLKKLALLCFDLGIWPLDKNVKQYVPVFTEEYFERKSIESKGEQAGACNP